MNQSTSSQEATASEHKPEEAQRLLDLDNPDEILKILREGIRNDETGLIKKKLEQKIVDIVSERASELHNQGKFREACLASVNNLEIISDGFDEEGKLTLMNDAALNLLHMGKYLKSYELLKEVSRGRLQLLGPNNEETLATQFKLAEVLYELGEHEHFLGLCNDILERTKEDDPIALNTRRNMGVLMLKTGTPKDALDQLEYVLGKRMRISGPDHLETLMVQENLADALFELERFPEALEVFTQVFDKRKEILGLDHPHTQTPQAYLGHIMAAQGDYLGALEKYNLVLEKFKAMLGDSHSATRSISRDVKVLTKRVGSKKFTQPQTLCEKHIEFKRLHYLISIGDTNGVKALLADGIVDITQVTAHKGNTALHIAVNKNNTDIVESLLRYARRNLTSNEFDKFINAKTTSAVGNTAMHIAAINGSLNLIEALLKYGADYRMKNKEGKTPVDQTNEPVIKSFFNLFDRIYM